MTHLAFKKKEVKMRVIKRTQNAVILCIKAHYYALYAFKSRLHYYGNAMDMTFSEIFSANLKIYEYRLGLACMRISRFKEYALEGI